MRIKVLVCEVCGKLSARSARDVGRDDRDVADYLSCPGHVLNVKTGFREMHLAAWWEAERARKAIRPYKDDATRGDGGYFVFRNARFERSVQWCASAEDARRKEANGWVLEGRERPVEPRRSGRRAA